MKYLKYLKENSENKLGDYISDDFAIWIMDYYSSQAEPIYNGFVDPVIYAESLKYLKGKSSKIYRGFCSGDRIKQSFKLNSISWSYDHNTALSFSECDTDDQYSYIIEYSVANLKKVICLDLIISHITELQKSKITNPITKSYFSKNGYTSEFEVLVFDEINIKPSNLIILNH